MLCTLLEPTSGTARLNGYDILKQPNQVRQSLGTVLAGERSIYWKLTARENLEYFAALYHIPPDIAKKRIADLLKRVELDMRANDLVEKYSSGMKQRVAISKALLSNPPILLLVGRTITNMITTAITSLAMILIAALVFGFRPTGNALAAFLTVLPMLVGLYSFGFAFAALVLIMREANTMVDVSSYLVQIFAGTNFPIDAPPRWLLPISLALPLTYGYDAVRGWLLHTRTILPIGIEIAMLIVFMFVLIALGTAAFNALERRVRVRGTLGQH